MLLLIPHNYAWGLLRDGRAARASSAADESRAPERRFPLLLGLVSYPYLFSETWSIFSAKNDYILVRE